MNSDKDTARHMTGPQKLMLALAILLIAGFGFVRILGGDRIGIHPSAVPTPEPTAQVAVEPTATPLPAATPLPTAKPAPEVVQADPARAEGEAGDQALAPTDPPLAYDEVTGSLLPKGIDLGETAEPTATPEASPDATASPAPDPAANMAETPTAGPLAGLKIGIDPGHQKKANNGKELVRPGGTEKKPKVSSGTSGVSTKVAEYVTNLEIALALRDALIAQGAEVLMTRETHDVDISNIERAEMMNEWGADLVLRIHCNGVDSKKKQGIGLYVTTLKPTAKESLAAAEAILPAMVSATGAKRDGIFKRDIYSGLNWSQVPSILVECGYMSNAEEDQKLNDPDYQKLLAEGMVQGVADYFERDLNGGDTSDESPDDGAGARDAQGGRQAQPGAMDGAQ